MRQIESEVVGCQFRPNQSIIRLLAQTIADQPDGYPVTIRPEPDNKYDGYALAVYYSEYPIGYLPKEKHIYDYSYFEEAEEYPAKITEAIHLSKKSLRFLIKFELPE